MRGHRRHWGSPRNEAGYSVSNWSEEDLKAYYDRLKVPTREREAAQPHPVNPGTPKSPVRNPMNATESAYAQILGLAQKVGEVTWWSFECVKIRVGHDCWLTPDFLVQYADGHLELHDTKGTKKRKSKRGPTKTYYAEEDAVVKARAIGENFPIPIFFVFRNGQEWDRVRM